jgi:predicted PurR-regulated permease PerM
MASEVADTEMSGDSRIPHWIIKAIAIFWLGWVVVYIGTGAVRALRPLLIVLLVSMFLSFAIEPAVNRMERAGIRRGIGTWIMFIAMFVTIGGFFAVVGTALATQINEFVDEVPGYLDEIEEWALDKFDYDLDLDQVRDEFVDGGGVEDLAGRFADDIVNVGATIINIVFQGFTVLLFTFYLVAEGPKVRRTVCGFLEPERQAQVLTVWDLAIEKTGGYIYSRTILAIISAAFHWVAFEIIEVPFPLPLALFVGVISQFIPVIGTYIAGALPVLIATLDQPSKGLWVLAVIAIYQQIENYVFAPKITAHTMEIHVAVAFGAVFAGAAVLGVVGALLALPFAATLQAFASTFVGHHQVEEEALARSARRRGRP